MVSKDYMRKALGSFIEMTSVEMVNDGCVGCNSFFTKYHPIESTVNPKKISYHFLYNTTPNKHSLLNEDKIIPPP